MTTKRLKQSKFKIVNDADIEPPLIESAQEYKQARDEFTRAQNNMLAKRNKLSIAMTTHMDISHVRTNTDFDDIANAICTAVDINNCNKFKEMNEEAIEAINKQLQLI